MTTARFAASSDSSRGTWDGSRLYVSRAEEADRLCAFITNAATRFVTLYGQPASGKSMLVVRWLIPDLETAKGAEGYGVYYGVCAPRLPDVVGKSDARFDDVVCRKSIIVIDEFDRVLDESRDERRQQLDALFEKLHRADSATIVVVIVSARQLTSVYALSSYDPGVVNGIVEINSVGLAEGLNQLSGESDARKVRGTGADLVRPEVDSAGAYTPAVLKALEDEAKEKSLDVTFDFVNLIHARFKQDWGGTVQRLIDMPQYDEVGGLEGILREHLDQYLDNLETERAGSKKIARAVLLRILESQSGGATADLREVAPRFGVSSSDVADVLRRLTDFPGALLIPTPNDQYQFQPPQISAILEEDSAAGQRQSDRTRRIVEEGLRNCQLLGTLLPSARFAEIHEQRTDLVLGDDLTRFLVQCALRQDHPELADATEYWLNRLASREDGMDILLSAVFDPSVAVRKRAAVLLGQFRDPLVRDRLYVLALTDDMPEVRTAAIESLTSMVDDELLAKLLHEVENPKSTNRERAIEALRIFPRPEVTRVLQGLLNDPGTQLATRTNALSVLAALNTTGSVDVLVDIALEDADKEDREAAAHALALTSTEDLNRHILSRLDWGRRPWQIVLKAMAVALTVVLYLRATVFVAAADNAVVTIASAAVRPLLPAVVGLVGLVGLLILTRVLLVKVNDGRLRPRSPGWVLAFTLFGLISITVLPWVHGLAHFMVKRKQRAIMLFGLEFLGIAFFFVIAVAMESTPTIRVLAYIYRFVGVFLFSVSYLYDVVPVALDTFVFKRAITRESRRSAIYQEVFGNPAMVTTVFTALKSAVGQEARRAKQIIRLFGARMIPETLVQLFEASDPFIRGHVTRALSEAKNDYAVSRLETVWGDASNDTRRAIANVLVKNPTARSIGALERLGLGEGAVFNLRAWFARQKFRLSVWPIYAPLAVILLLPMVGVFMYHGYKMVRNPAWGEIILLRQPSEDDPGGVAQRVTRLGVSNDRKAKITEFLANVYPDASLSELRRMFREGKTHPVDKVHAAVAGGLVSILDSTEKDTDLPRRSSRSALLNGLRGELAAEAIRFDSLLRAPDKSDYAAGRKVLATMARSKDTTLANTAIGYLVAFASEQALMSSGNSARLLDSTVDELSRAPYARALPALRKVLEAFNQKKGFSKNDEKIPDRIRDLMSQVAEQAKDTLSAQRRPVELSMLLKTVRELLPDQTDLIAQFDSAIKRSETSQGKDHALRFIAKLPELETDYRDLYGHFAADENYAQADTQFQRLVLKYPQSIWPRKILAEIYHENLSKGNQSFFDRSYDKMTALRRMPAFRDLEHQSEDYRRIEADFAEVALSARHYDDVDAVGLALLSTTPTPVERLNMSLFRYIASVMAHDPATSKTRLAELDRVVGTLPDKFNNNWVYPGTRVFIDGSDLPPALKEALRSLCREGEWYAPKDAKKIIEDNRKALETL